MAEYQTERRDIARDKVITRTSIIGIAANVALAGFKAVVGILSNSIAIVLDAVNNISDAGSSVITIIGTKLAGKQPDRKHPFGHGRIEYMSAMIIAVLVLYAGITSLTESIGAILHPEEPSYGAAALVIVAVAVVVKIVLGRYVKGVGEKVNSDSLVNSGTDAMMDSVISASTLVAAVIFLLTGISLEAWLGVIISAVIIKAGIDMLRETLSELLGDREALIRRQLIRTGSARPRTAVRAGKAARQRDLPHAGAEMIRGGIPFSGRRFVQCFSFLNPACPCRRIPGSPSR